MMPTVRKTLVSAADVDSMSEILCTIQLWYSAGKVRLISAGPRLPLRMVKHTLTSRRLRWRLVLIVSVRSHRREAAPGLSQTRKNVYARQSRHPRAARHRNLGNAMLLHQPRELGSCLV